MALAFAGIGVLLAAWSRRTESSSRRRLPRASHRRFAAWLIMRHLLAQTTPLFRHSLAEWQRMSTICAQAEPET
jgi:hypothetical protein